MRRFLPLIAVVLAGCGASRTAVPDVSHPLAPARSESHTIRDAGVVFSAPSNWEDVPAEGPLVGGVRSNTATVAIWRYPRSETLPAGRGALEAAERRLTALVQKRNETFRLRASRIREHGVELLGSQTIAGVRVDVRSTHVYRHGAEIVIDQYAPPDDFPRVDEQVFVPLLRSLRISAP